MNIFLLNYIIISVEAFFLLYRPAKNEEFTDKYKLGCKKAFIVLACIQWIMISGLRADSVGSDTGNYMRIFDMHKNMTFDDLINYFKNYYTNDGDYEPGYVLLERVIAIFTHNHVVYKFIIAIIFMSSMGKFIYKHSEDPFMAFVLYSGLFYNMFSLTGYRQVISVTIGIFWGYEYIKKRKFMSFLILVLIASTFHKSTLIFLLYYFMYNKKVDGLYAVVSLAIIGFMIVNRNQLFYYVKDIVGYDEYGVEGNFTQRNFLIMAGMLAILVIWRFKHVVQVHPKAHSYYNALILSGMMLPFAMVSPTSMRLVYDFGFMLMSLLPLVLKSIKIERDKVLIYGAIVAVFGFFVATRTPEYLFFWQ